MAHFLKFGPTNEKATDTIRELVKMKLQLMDEMRFFSGSRQNYIEGHS